MSRNSFDRLVYLVRKGSSALGISENKFIVNKETISFSDAGIVVWWISNSFGTDRGGWQIRETYNSFNLSTAESHLISKTIGSFSEDDVYGAAKAVLSLVLDKKLEFALDQAMDESFKE